MSKIVITGASGMIGSALCRLGSERGDEVTAIVRKGSQKKDRLPSGVRVVECDLSALNDLYPDFSADIFFHLAWDKTRCAGRDDCITQQNNIKYTLDAVGLASRLGCSVFVGAGSQAEYGIKSEKLTGDTVASPKSAYGISKLAAGKLSALMCEQYGIRHNWARILSVYGEGDNPNSLISYLIKCFTSGVKPELTPCEQTWDYINSCDCALALYLIGKNGKHGKVYPIGSGKPRKLSEYVLSVRDAINAKVEIGFGEKDYYPHQPMYLVADISELTRDTGFVPKIEFEDGIKRLLE